MGSCCHGFHHSGTAELPRRKTVSEGNIISDLHPIRKRQLRSYYPALKNLTTGPPQLRRRGINDIARRLD